MNESGVPLSKYINGEIFRGIVTGYNKAFVIDRKQKEQLIAADSRSKEIIKPFVVGNDVRHYHINYQEKYLIFARRGIDIDLYPAVKKHLEGFKEQLMPKPKGWEGKWKGRKPGSYAWYEIQDTIDYFDDFEKHKIIYPDIAKESRIAFDDTGLYFSNTVYFIPVDDKYLLGLLNSKLIFAYFKRISSVLGDADKGGRLRWFRQDVSSIPIRSINFSNPAEKAGHDKMVALVENMLELHRRQASAKTPREKEMLERQIETTDKAIDSLVYELYSLTEEEIKIVEGE